MPELRPIWGNRRGGDCWATLPGACPDARRQTFDNCDPCLRRMVGVRDCTPDVHTSSRTSARLFNSNTFALRDVFPCSLPSATIRIEL